MKYLIVNDTDTLANIDASDEILMFPQNRVLGLESIDDTTTAFLVRCLGVLFGLFRPLSPALFSLAFSAVVSAIVKNHVYDILQSSCFQ